jgi:hypothetical protein
MKLLVMLFSLVRLFNTDIIRSGNDVWLVKYLAVSHAAVSVYDGRSDSFTPSSCVRWCRKGSVPPRLLGWDIAVYKALQFYHFLEHRDVGKIAVNIYVNLSKPTGHVMHQQFNIQQLYALPTLYLCVLYLSENKQRLVA